MPIHSSASLDAYPSTPYESNACFDLIEKAATLHELRDPNMQTAEPKTCLPLITCKHCLSRALFGRQEIVSLNKL